MKKLTLLFTFFAVLICIHSFGQSEKETGKGEFKNFKVDVSSGYAIPTSGGGGSKGGALVAIEPKYAVMQNLSVGLRLEGAATESGINLTTGTTSGNASVKAAVSYIVTGDYYFSDNNTRPFLGAGAGIFQTKGIAVSSTSANPNIGEGSKFGGMIRGGMEYKHLRIGVEYNIVSKTTVPAYTYSNGTTPPTSTTIPAYDIKNGYIGLKLGVVIGGGRK